MIIIKSKREIDIMPRLQVRSFEISRDSSNLA